MGTLFVVATPIGNLEDMSPRAIDVLRSVQLIAAEDTRHSGTLRSVFDISTPMISYHHHNRSQREQRLLAALAVGDVALITDAGTPGISDPGQEIVAAALAAGHTVSPIPGPSAVIAAVSASGLVTGPFIFLGFLDRKSEIRRQQLETAKLTSWPLVIYESPQRVLSTLRDLAGVFGDAPTVIARELTKLHEEITLDTLSNQIAALQTIEPRGEYVIVLRPIESQPPGETDPAEVARRLLQDGLKPSRAARMLAEICSIPGDQAYEIVRRVKDEN